MRAVILDWIGSFFVAPVRKAQRTSIIFPRLCATGSAAASKRITASTISAFAAQKTYENQTPYLLRDRATMRRNCIGHRCAGHEQHPSLLLHVHRNHRESAFG